VTLLQRTAKRVLGLVLPSRCVGCGTRDTYLCDACISGMSVPSPRTLTADAFAFDSATSAVVYDCVAREAVHRFKFKNLRALAPLLVVPVARLIPASLLIDAVVPVPQHPSRLRERGYNQAALLGEGIAASVGVPFEPTWLARPHQVGHQVEARNIAERQANVRSAFMATSAVAGLRVALVDDVMTTGATLDAAAAALKAAGAGEVHCFTFARDA
jgi:ComF family protein